MSLAKKKDLVVIHLVKSFEVRVSKSTINLQYVYVHYILPDIVKFYLFCYVSTSKQSILIN